MSLPLDSEFSFVPSDDDRPAGEWIEGYWIHAARWAKIMSYCMGGYTLLSLVPQLQLLSYLSGTLLSWPNIVLMVGASLITWIIPLGLLAWFGFQFARQLEVSIKLNDQKRIERAFGQLRSFLIVAIIAASFRLLYAGYEAYATWNYYNETSIEAAEDYIPLESE